jgi:hypothetical protein
MPDRLVPVRLGTVRTYSDYVAEPDRYTPWAPVAPSLLYRVPGWTPRCTALYNSRLDVPVPARWLSRVRDFYCCNHHTRFERAAIEHLDARFDKLAKLGYAMAMVFHRARFAACGLPEVDVIWGWFDRWFASYQLARAETGGDRRLAAKADVLRECLAPLLIPGESDDEGA